MTSNHCSFGDVWNDIHRFNIRFSILNEFELILMQNVCLRSETDRTNNIYSNINRFGFVVSITISFHIFYHFFFLLLPVFTIWHSGYCVLYKWMILPDEDYYEWHGSEMEISFPENDACSFFLFGCQRNSFRCENHTKIYIMTKMIWFWASFVHNVIYILHI